MKQVSPRTLTILYLAALLLVAGLATLSHFSLVQELRLSERSAALIELSGRQRMLSQRIAGMAAEYRLGIPGARESLLGATAAFEQNHRDLVAETRALPSDQAARQILLQLYLDGPASIQQRSQSFLSTARQLANTPPTNPSAQGLSTQLFLQARSPLLDKLDRAVSFQQQQSEANLRSFQRDQNLILGVILATLALEAFFIFRPMVQHITIYSSTLVSIASTDSLTGLPNRRAFIDSGNQELMRAHRYQRPISLLMLDVDHFKSVNDTHGHAVGDQVLKSSRRNSHPGPAFHGYPGPHRRRGGRRPAS